MLGEAGEMEGKGGEKELGGEKGLGEGALGSTAVGKQMPHISPYKDGG